MSPESQAGTDHADIKEQARQAMLRARDAVGSTDADEQREDEADEVVVAEEDPEVEPAEAEDEDADEADDPEDEADDDDEPDAEDDDVQPVAEEEPPTTEPTTPGKKKRKQSKLARANKTIEDLRSEVDALKGGVSAEVERILAEKAEADARLADLRREQAEDNQRIKRARDYMQQVRGTDDEHDQLVRFIARFDDADPLSVSEEDRARVRNAKARLNQIISGRDIMDLAAEVADADLKDMVSGILGGFARSLKGVDPDFHHKLKFAPAIQHVYDSGYAQGKAEYEAEVAKQAKRIADLEGRLSAAKTQKRAPLAQVPAGGTPAAPRPKPKPLDQQTPIERAESLGMFGKDGRIDPDFKAKLRSGKISLLA